VREREADEIDLVDEEVKEEERRRVEERGAGGVARDRRANAEPDRRAFIVGYEGMKFGRKESVESEVWSRRNEEQLRFPGFRGFWGFVGVDPGLNGRRQVGKGGK
jgi:hypothetical protein